MDFKQICKSITTITASFVDIRRSGYTYVDKTDLIYELAWQRSFYFLSRPRRFGKSTLVSTLEELFLHGVKSYEGHDSYFKGLEIEKKWTDENEYLVFHLDISTIQGKANEDSTLFAKSLKRKIIDFAKSNSLEVDESCEGVFETFEYILNQVDGPKVVLLIDEYDYPLTKNLDLKDNFDGITKVLRELYTAVKVYASKFRFCFITGITRYKDSSIFTAGSPISDISQDEKFGTLVGITKDELLTFYKPNLQWIASVKNHKSFEEVTASDLEKTLDEITYWYDGYCFDSECKTHVYTTWSILKLFQSEKAKFEKYWYDIGGLPSILTHSFDKIIENKDEILSNDLAVRVGDFDNPSSFTDMDARVLLFQTGYLSFSKPKDDTYYYLKFPNFEVFSAFKTHLLAKAFKQSEQAYRMCMMQDIDCLENVSEIVDFLEQILNLVDFEQYPINSEAAVVNCIYLFLCALKGSKVSVNQHTSLGRADLVVDSDNRRLVFEFKFCKIGNDPKALLKKAQDQMIKKRYGKTANTPQNLQAIALVFSQESRSFVEFSEVKY